MGILNDRRSGGIKQVCEREVIESDEGDLVLKLRSHDTIVTSRDERR